MFHSPILQSDPYKIRNIREHAELSSARPRHAATNRTSAMTVPMDGLPHQLFRTSKFLGLVTSIDTTSTAAQEHSQKIGQCVHIASKTINDCFRDSSIGGPVVYIVLVALFTAPFAPPTRSSLNYRFKIRCCKCGYEAAMLHVNKGLLPHLTMGLARKSNSDS
jgi:hypothetical protein